MGSRRRTEFRARFTGDIPIASGGAASAAKPHVNEKKQSAPRRQEWAAASHGVGRKPGDGKAWYQYIASLSVTPTCVGVPVSFWVVRVVPPATLTRGGSTTRYGYVALPGSKFLGLSARQSPIGRDEGGFFKNGVDVSIAYKIFGTRVIRHNSAAITLA